MASVVEKELVKATGLTREEKEADQAWFLRLFEAADRLDDEVFKGLDPTTQNWINSALEAVEAKPAQPLPNFNGEVSKEAAAPKEAKANGKAKPKAKAKAAPDAPAAKEKGGELQTQKPAKGKEIKLKPKTPPARPTKAVSGIEARGRKPLYAPDKKIKMLVDKNPHRPKTTLHGLFAKYKTGMTVQQAQNAGIPLVNMRYLVGLGHIKIG